MKYHGTAEELYAYLDEVGYKGEWREKGGTHFFRAKSGEVVNFYSNGTVQVQGQNQEVVKGHLDALCSGSVVAPVVATAEKKNVQIFIVHGHDEAARNELELVLRRLNLEPYILQNANAGSKTLIEALEDGIYKDAAFGIVLMTPDDIGYSVRDGESGARARARQNVILEMGMVMAALSRTKMAILKKRGELELPSDTDGIVRLEYATRVQEQVPGLVQHLMDAGIDVDPSLIATASR